MVILLWTVPGEQTGEQFGSGVNQIGGQLPARRETNGKSVVIRLVAFGVHQLVMSKEEAVEDLAGAEQVFVWEVADKDYLDAHAEDGDLIGAALGISGGEEHAPGVLLLIVEAFPAGVLVAPGSAAGPRGIGRWVWGGKWG